MGALYRVGPGVPTAGKITLKDLYGSAASTPSAAPRTLATIDSYNQTPSGTVDIGSQVTDVYGEPLAFSLAGNASNVFTATPTLTGQVAAYTVASNRWLRANVFVSANVVNRFGRSARANVLATVTGPPPTVTGTPPVRYKALLDGSTTGSSLVVSVNSYVADSSDSALTYVLTQNHDGGASLSGPTLTIAPVSGWGGRTYKTLVTNAYGQVAEVKVTTNGDSGGLVGLWYPPSGGTITLVIASYNAGTDVTDSGVWTYVYGYGSEGTGVSGVALYGGYWPAGGSYSTYRADFNEAGTFYAKIGREVYGRTAILFNNGTLGSRGTW